MVDNYSRTALYLAARGGHLKIVRYLIEEEKLRVWRDKEYYDTALHYVTRGGHLGVVKYLVKKQKANVSTKDDNGRTPLHLAVGGGHLGVVKYLVTEKNADIKEKDKNGWTTIHCIALNNNFELMQEIVMYAKIGKNLSLKFQRGVLDIVEAMLLSANEESQDTTEEKKKVKNFIIKHSDQIKSEVKKLSSFIIRRDKIRICEINAGASIVPIVILNAVAYFGVISFSSLIFIVPTAIATTFFIISATAAQVLLIKDRLDVATIKRTDEVSCKQSEGEKDARLSGVNSSVEKAKTEGFQVDTTSISAA